MWLKQFGKQAREGIWKRNSCTPAEKALRYWCRANVLLERSCVSLGKNHASKTFARWVNGNAYSSCFFRFLLFHSLPFSEADFLDWNTFNCVIVVSEKSGGTDEKSGPSLQDGLRLFVLFFLSAVTRCVLLRSRAASCRRYRNTVWPCRQQRH